MIHNLFYAELMELRVPDHANDGFPTWRIEWTASVEGDHKFIAPDLLEGEGYIVFQGEEKRYCFQLHTNGLVMYSQAIDAALARSILRRCDSITIDFVLAT